MPKVCLIHPAVHDLPSMLSYLGVEGPVDGLEWDASAPEILIATEFIYYRKPLFEQFRRLYPFARVKAICLQEALEPDFNVFDYAFGFGDAHSGDPRFCRLPGPLEMFGGFLDGSRSNSLTDPAAAAEELSAKTGFCNFIYSNPAAHPMRDAIFRKLCEYKKVDSLGRHLNNVTKPGTGWSGSHKAEGLALRRPYKFSIASENARFAGYVSEKILVALQAHTVPVYWGDPDIAETVNPECFINAADYPDLDALLQRVREVDADDALWIRYVTAPWFTPEQEAALERRSADYRERLLLLLAGKLAPTAPEGYHAGLYRKHFFENSFPLEKPGGLSRLLRKFAR